LKGKISDQIEIQGSGDWSVRLNDNNYYYVQFGNNFNFDTIDGHVVLKNDINYFNSIYTSSDLMLDVEFAGLADYLGDNLREQVLNVLGRYMVEMLGQPTIGWITTNTFHHLQTAFDASYTILSLSEKLINFEDNFGYRG